MDKAKQDQRVSALLEGQQLPEDEAAELLADLERNDEFRSSAAKALVLHRNLSQQQIPEGDFVAQVLGTLRSEADEKSLTGSVITKLKTRQSRQRRVYWITAGLAAAALIMMGLFVAFQRPADEAPSIRIIAAENIGTLKMERLYNGERVGIRRGILELDLNGRARVVIEAPARFTLLSADHIFLHSGRCYAEMKKGDSGLLIETPYGEALDLGTQFGVAVSQTEDMEVHVFDGEVRVSGSSTESLIQEGEAIALESSGSRRDFAAARGNFVSQVPRGDREAQPFLYWSLDEGDGSLAEAKGAANQINKARGTLKSQPRWIDGISGKALEFNGVDAWVSTAHPGIGGSSDRTVACWIKIPADWSRGETAPLISWGLIKSREESGRGWMLGVARHKARFGALRLSLGEQQVVGSTSLADGRWHHVAAVAMSGEQGPTVLLYVDGQLENVTRDTLESMATETDHTESETIRFGRQIFWEDHFLRGALDEVYLFNAALSGDQIRALMRGEKFETE